jgi:hypothetical protein
MRAQVGRRRWLGTSIAIGVLLLLATGGIALAERVQFGKIILDVDGGFSPTSLPKHAFAPISLRANINIGTTDGTVPPTLQRIVLEFDRNGRVATQGLPVCQPARLEGTVTADARRACKRAIVGTGSATAEVTFPDQAPIPATAPLTIFNGPRRGGRPTIVVHAYTTVPAPTTFVVQATIERAGGRYGFRVSTDVPPIAGGYGALTHLAFRVGKRYRVHGRLHSYASARCADGRLQAQGAFFFADGSSVMGSLFRPCKTRG